MRKIKFVLIVVIYLIIVMNNKFVYSSFADYTDEDAARDTEKLIEEHDTNFDNDKSSNNYLKSLNIDKGKLSPTFDKQITNYNLAIENDIEEIVVSANTEDDKANVNGVGKISIKEKKQCSIEVTAESGTVRTYFINIIRPDENYINSTLAQEDENIVTETTEENITIETDGIDNKKNITSIISIVIGILVIIIIFIIFRKNRK